MASSTRPGPAAPVRGLEGRGTWSLLVLALLSLLVSPGPVWAQDGEGGEPPPEGAVWLLLPVGAKGVALGRAVTALPGAESVWWNPAGLGEVERSRFLLFRGEDLAGEATAAALILARPGVGTLGLAYQLMDAGTQDLRDRDGNVLGTVGLRNHLGVLSMATRFWDHLSLGVNLKLIQSRVSCRGQCIDAGVTATGFALDAGAQAAEVGGLPLRFGATLAHAGPDFQFVNEEQADRLPTRLRLAVAYEVLSGWTDLDEVKLWVTTELERRVHRAAEGEKSTATYVGAEFAAGTAQMLYLRAGYVFNALSQVDGAAVGLGLRYESFDLAIAKSLAASTLGGESEPVHVSFGFVF